MVLVPLCIPVLPSMIGASVFSTRPSAVIVSDNEVLLGQCCTSAALWCAPLDMHLLQGDQR